MDRTEHQHDKVPHYPADPPKPPNRLPLCKNILAEGTPSRLRACAQRRDKKRARNALNSPTARGRDQTTAKAPTR
jgi:hypothetical protein